MSNPKQRFKENITSATALIIIGLSVIAYGLSVPYTWLFFVVGLFVVVPLVGMLFGADDWREWDPLKDEFWEDIFGEESETEPTAPTSDDTTSKEDALTTLRDRYARGELTDEQFERKLNLLLETESMEDIEQRFNERNHRERITDRE